ncbi:MAG: hypothetical protein V3V96_10625 [Acidiferrobacterales bacterium]
MHQRKLTLRDHAAMGLLILGSIFITTAIAAVIVGLVSVMLFIIGVVFQFTDVGVFGCVGFGSMVASVVMLVVGGAILWMQRQLTSEGEEDSDVPT